MTRIGNIEFRLTQTIGEPPRDYVEIVKWYPNKYYKRENEFEKEGEWYIHRDSFGYRYRMHENCFTNPESCYTIATLDIKEEPDVISVGLRPFDLEPDEEADYKEVVKQAYQYTYNLWKRQNSL